VGQKTAEAVEKILADYKKKNVLELWTQKSQRRPELYARVFLTMFKLANEGRNNLKVKELAYMVGENPVNFHLFLGRFKDFVTGLNVGSGRYGSGVSLPKPCYFDGQVLFISKKILLGDKK